MEGAIADKKHFPAAFERPVQIYRFLQARYKRMPFMLHRTLSYMNGRNKRKNGGRKSFKMDEIQGIKERETLLREKFANYLQIGIVSFMDSSHSKENMKGGSHANVHISIESKKRSSNALMLGSTKASLNTAETRLGKKIPVITTSSEILTGFNSHDSSAKLVFKVDYLDGSSATKRSRSTFEVDIFNKDGKCILPKGDYELQMTHEKTDLEYNSWEDVPNPLIKFRNSSQFAGYANNENLDQNNLVVIGSSDINSAFDLFDETPKLHLYLDWVKDPSSRDFMMYKAPALMNLKTDVDMEIDDNNNHNKTNEIANNFSTIFNGSIVKKETTDAKFIFQFTYEKNKQHCEERYNYDCPFCFIDCMRLDSLLKHLRLWHARFQFIYMPPTDKKSLPKIDVGINENFDNYNDINIRKSKNRRKRQPIKREVFTKILVYAKATAKEFLRNDEDSNPRIYYKTTMIPVTLNGMDVDSEDEFFPLWTQRKTIQRIDGLFNANEGEKEMMKLWNLHVMKHKITGNCQVAESCDVFFQNNKDIILKNNLYRNFVTHLSSLHDYGFILPQQVNKYICEMQKCMREPEYVHILNKNRKDEIDQWQNRTDKDLKLKTLKVERNFWNKKTKFRSPTNLESDVKNENVAGTSGVQRPQTARKSSTRKRLHY